MTRRVAVTGIGLMTALGTTREQVWDGLVAGRCGIGDVTLFDPAGYRSHKAAEIPALPRDPAFSEKEWARPSRSAQSALVASGEAVAGGGVLESGLAPDRIGVVLGSGTGDMKRNEGGVADMGRDGIPAAPPAKEINYLSDAPP